MEQEELFLQAIEALDAGKTDTMVQLLERALPLDPTNPFAYVKRGQLFDLIGNNSRAVEDFSKAWRIGRPSPMSIKCAAAINSSSAT